MESSLTLLLIVALLVGGISVCARISNARTRKDAQQAKEAAQQRALILAACNESMAAYENIPKDLMTAEELLDVAETEFRDNAFSYFWDSIERATRKLGEVDGSIKLIADRSIRYKAVAETYRGRPPPFPVDPETARRLGTALGTAGRLKQISRQAGRNFEFATIYEQRKTREILMDGFTNLGDAIYGLGERLEQSIDTLGGQVDDLSSSMTAMNEKVVDAVKGVSSAVGEVSSRVDNVSSAIKASDTNAQAAMADQAARQAKANRMLDNIQHRRTPPPLAID